MLDELFATASDDAEIRRKTVTTDSLESLISKMPPTASVIEALRPTEKIKLIAEIKRASPSVGEMAEIPDVGELAKVYEESGAHAISVLTERSGFAGSLDDLKFASDAASIPTLRKDFISCEYQILEARAHGASFILLILSWLKESDFIRLAKFASELGLDVLVETHTPDEIHMANAAGSQIVGINTRNLQTFKTDLGLFEAMAHLLPQEAIRVAESSVKKAQDVTTYWNAGANVVLVGQALVTGDPRVLIPEFIAAT